jgi:hypothetical protein
VNLDLDPAQRDLVAAVRRSAATAPAAATGWRVFDAIGLTDLLTSTNDGRPVVGLFEWCLILEELGADCRSLAVIRSVRMFMDVFVHGHTAAATPLAAETFLALAGSHRAPLPSPLLTWRRTGADELVLSPGTGLTEVATTLPGVTLEKREAEHITDRDLLACSAYAVGIGRRCLELAHERARKRVVARRRLLEYQGVSHRLAEVALELSAARIGVWRTAWREDAGEPAGHLAPATAAACVAAVLTSAHTAVQIFGAAGTSDPTIVGLYRAAYDLADVCGSARSLWLRASSRWGSQARGV